MIYPSIDKLLNLIDSKYKLIHIAASRSKGGFLQMNESSYKCKRNIGRALEEVQAGLITIKNK